MDKFNKKVLDNKQRLKLQSSRKGSASSDVKIKMRDGFLYQTKTRPGVNKAAQDIKIKLASLSKEVEDWNRYLRTAEGEKYLYRNKLQQIASLCIGQPGRLAESISNVCKNI